MKRAPELSPPVWLRYTAAAGGSFLAIAITFEFRPIFLGVPFIPAFLAVFFAGWFGGGGPSLFALLTTGGCLAFLVLFSEFRLADPHDPLRILLFLVVGLVASLLQRELWSTRRQRAESMEAEERMRLSSEAAREDAEHVLEAIADGFCTLDRRFRFTYSNSEAERIFGRSSEELLGVDALEELLFRGPGSAALRAAMEGSSDTREFFDERRRRWLEVRAYPAREGVSMLVRDVTDRAEANATDQRLAAIIESSEDAIIAKDLNGTVTAWNPGAERLFGYTAEEMVGTPISVLMPPDHSQDMREILDRIRCGERVSCVVRLRGGCDSIDRDLPCRCPCTCLSTFAASPRARRSPATGKRDDPHDLGILLLRLRSPSGGRRRHGEPRIHPPVPSSLGERESGVADPDRGRGHPARHFRARTGILGPRLPRLPRTNTDCGSVT
jgi:PAS domain S-box-containing protein